MEIFKELCFCVTEMLIKLCLEYSICDNQENPVADIFMTFEILKSLPFKYLLFLR